MTADTDHVTVPVEDLHARLTALRDAATLLGRHGIDVGTVDVDGVVTRSTGRLRHGTDRTVVALVGSTGSGKSSLLNALAGEEVARTGVTRPTTSITQAVTFGGEADGLLDHLGVSLRHQVPPAEHLDGLVLLDLPDFDSVARAHRDEVNRLVELVDLMAWVTDPQKYADEALHDGYLKPLSSHRDVMHVLLNKVDTVSGAQAQTCLEDLARLLRDDGLGELQPIGTSTVTGEGLDAVRGVLAAEVAARAAAVERISADVRTAAQALRAAAGATLTLELDKVRHHAVDGLSDAAAVGQNAALVGQQYRRDAGLSTGWPPLRILRRLRRAPLERQVSSGGSAIAEAEVSRSLRAAAESIADASGGSGPDAGGGSGWSAAAASAVRQQVDAVTQALDTQTSRGIQTLRVGPRWWGAARGLQRLWLLLLVVGVVWLLGIAAAQTFLLIDVEPYIPRWRGIAAPTGLAGVGLAGGLLTALVGRWLGAIGARRQIGRARGVLRERVAGVVDAHVIDPVTTLLADAEHAAVLLDRAAARDSRHG